MIIYPYLLSSPIPLPMYKMLTCEAVVRAAETLIHMYGSVTALEVKQALRRDGYWALQQEVSYFMQHLALIEGWMWRDDVRGRQYTFADSASTALASCYVLHLN